MRIGVLVSGGGTNLEALLTAIDEGRVKSGRVVTVVSNKAGAGALPRAARRGINCRVISREEFGEAAEGEILAHMKAKKVELVVLAGFTAILGEALLKAYPRRLINIHPSLLPAFCGCGYYGIRVHEAALRRGVKITGATVHFVNEIVDGGEIILQKAVPVLRGDTAKTLQRRVMEKAEWVILPKAVELICSGKIK